MLGQIFVPKLSICLSVTKYEHATPKPTHILIKFRDPRHPHLFDTVKEVRYLNPFSAKLLMVSKNGPTLANFLARHRIFLKYSDQGPSSRHTGAISYRVRSIVYRVV